MNILNILLIALDLIDSVREQYVLLWPSCKLVATWNRGKKEKVSWGF